MAWPCARKRWIAAHSGAIPCPGFRLRLSDRVASGGLSPGTPSRFRSAVRAHILQRVTLSPHWCGVWPHTGMEEMSVENLLFWLECEEYREIKAP